MKSTLLLIPFILMAGCSMNPYALTKEQQSHIQYIEYTDIKDIKPIEPIAEPQPIELINGDVLLPPNKVKLTIDPKDVVYLDGVPYVQVDGVYYRIVEFIHPTTN